MTSSPPAKPFDLTLIARWLVVVSAASISLPTQMLSISTTLFLIVWLVSGHWKEKWGHIWNHPVARAALIGYGLLVVGLLWTTAELDWALKILGKYHKLLLIPMMLTVITDKFWGMRVLYGLVAGHLIGMVVSYLQWLGYIPPLDGTFYTGFHPHIAYSVIEAFCIFVLAWLLVKEQSNHKRILFAALIATLLFNLLFINTGRTGYIVLIGITLFFFMRLIRWKGVVLATALLCLAGTVAYLYSPPFKERIIGLTYNTTLAPTTEYADPRIVYWNHALDIVKKHPLFGTGTGSFAHEFSKIAEQDHLTGMYATENPHDEYLLIAVQLGIVGLLYFLWLGRMQWKLTLDMDETASVLAQGFLIIFATDAVFNSVLMDSQEGHLYALMSVALWAEAGKK